MEVWQQLISSAVLGTERQPVTLPPQEGSLGAMLARLQGNDPEHLLLGAAAAVSLYRHAGQTPIVDGDDLPTPCAPETQPVCSAEAREYLGLLCSGQCPDALPEWLSFAIQAGVCVPAEYLPALLSLNTRDAQLRKRIAAVAGQRGRWLAQFNPEWAFLLASADSLDEELWTSEHRESRIGYLMQMRRSDPARARELLAASWEKETPKDRAAFLETFLQGLSPEDEPFLEAALDDRRKEVRTVAVDLLARLPESRLSREMFARVRPLLSFTPAQPMRLFPPSPARKAKIEVQLPESCDKAMQRDGIDQHVPAKVEGYEEKAWWLLQMLSLLPPHRWCIELGEAPEVLINAAMESEQELAVLSGWMLATIRFCNTDWAKPLCPVHLNNSAFASGSDELMQVLTPAQWNEITIVAVRSSTGDQRCPYLHYILDRSPVSWSRELSGLVAEKISRCMASSHVLLWESWAEGYDAENYIRTFARYAHPSSFTQVEHSFQEGLARLNDDQQRYWEQAISDARGYMQFRDGMYRAFGQA